MTNRHQVLPAAGKGALGTYVLKRRVSVSALSDVFASNVVGLCRDLDNHFGGSSKEGPSIQLHCGIIRFPRYGIANALQQTKATEEHDQTSLPSEKTMRSELVFGAMAHVSNRFLLTQLASKAARKFHRPNTRIQETMDDVFVRFRRTNPIAGVPDAGNAQSFGRARKAETHSRYLHRNQSVA
jgi:hypothetical protein